MIDQPMTYQEWISQPEVQAKILAGLDKLAVEGPNDNGWIGGGICYSLKYGPGPLRYALPNEYSFVAAHSDTYNVFYKADAHLKGDDKWDGERGEFRREWCKNMAAALRANPSLWLKEIA